MHSSHVDCAHEGSELSLCWSMTPGLSKDTRCHVRPYSVFASLQIKHQATRKIGSQPGACS